MSIVQQKIAIAGAGPAGTGLAIRLALRGADVTLIERETFPRQKLCGEFISPGCFEHFAELGVLDEMLVAGGDRIFETAFYSPSGRSVTIPSSFIGGENALSLSRAEMDLILLRRAEAVGVKVYEDARPSELIVRSDVVKGIRFRSSSGEIISLESDIVVDATGRAGALSRLLQKQSSNLRTRTIAKPNYVGFKTHMTGIDLEPGRCEIYFFRGGYIGISNIEGGLANACFLVDSAAVRGAGSDADEVVRRFVFTNARARQTMTAARASREWLAVPVSGYGKKELRPAPGLFCVGDSAAFIDPFTGSGMLLAFESASILSDAITGNMGVPQRMAAQYADAHASRFDSRLRASAFLRRAAFTPRVTSAAIRIAGASASLTEMLAKLTRGHAVSVFPKR